MNQKLDLVLIHFQENLLMVLPFYKAGNNTHNLDNPNSHIQQAFDKQDNKGFVAYPNIYHSEVQKSCYSCELQKSREQKVEDLSPTIGVILAGILVAVLLPRWRVLWQGKPKKESIKLKLLWIVHTVLLFLIVSLLWLFLQIAYIEA